MTKPIAFASDFDGTLCFHDNGGDEFRPRDLEAIRAYQAAGGLFGICTGRPYGGLVFQSEPHVKQDFCIAASGAAIYDAKGELLWGKNLDDATVLELNALYQPQVDVCIILSSEFYVLGDTELDWPILHKISSLDEVGGPIFGFSIETGTVEQAADIAAEIAERFADVCVGYQNLNSVDVVAPGCSKGTGVAFVREHFGAERIGCMGDSFNDLPMLRAADASYTFPHVAEEVRAAADRLVDGVAEALADFVG